MKKKILGIVLALAMVLTMIPTAVFADDSYDIYTLDLPTAQAVYVLDKSSASDNKVNFEAQWNDYYGPMFSTRNPGTTWAVTYDMYESLFYAGNKKFDSEESFVYGDLKGNDNVSLMLLVLTDSAEIAPGTSYTVYYATCSKDGGAIVIDDSSIASGKLFADLYTASDLVEAEGDVTEDVIVDYTYTAPTNTAEKVFNVTVDYTFPATLDAKGDQNVYTWSPADGKYTKDELTNDNKASYTLSNSGAFEIKVTNKSNVDIDYEVSYAANESAVFVSGIKANTWENEAGTLATIAGGQEVTETGINITNVTNATTGSTNFTNATCKGTLEVTGINANKEPLASGTDKLGTFTIGISEKITYPDNTVGSVLLDSLGKDLLDEVPWFNGSETGALCYTDVQPGGKALLFVIPPAGPTDPPISIDGVYLMTAVTAGTSCYTCKSEEGADITFAIEGNLLSITVENESVGNEGLNGTYTTTVE